MQGEAARGGRVGRATGSIRGRRGRDSAGFPGRRCRPPMQCPVGDAHPDQDVRTVHGLRWPGRAWPV